ncbi:MAG: lipoate--protein ligase family protein [Candidatus Izemoplasmatales bacterium]|nr:lipoate--protein ligase family protein [Candidatus Izemoplasmatales bacterium]
MAVLINDSLDPYFNLATEEYFIRNDILKEDILIIWRSNPAFVFGRNQNPYNEISPEYFNKKIPIIRRISGGGTVYLDEQTINYTYITCDYKRKISNYKYFTDPIIEELNILKVPARFVPKSHIFVNDKKISGNAQAFINNKLMHHGTLLFNSNLQIIYSALVNFKIQENEHKILSNKSDVTNISDYIGQNISIDILIDRLVKTICYKKDINSSPYVLTEKDVLEIQGLVESKYLKPGWNLQN